jgi:serine-type D-Ala-D-Ala endopeptidase (penicillin-binding protein 7)
LVMNAANKNILLEKNSKQVLPIASLSKLIAAKIFLGTKPDLKKIVVYKKADEEQNERYAKDWEISKLKLKDGDKLSINDLLRFSLVGSTNNTIETLVRISGLKREDFIDKMNDYALKLGASSTVFVEPTGLSPKNVSSARDYAIIIKDVLADPNISPITVLTSYQTRISDRVLRVYNTDKLILKSKYRIIGSKTGHLDEAGYCLALKTAYNKKEYIFVILGSATRESNFQSAENLMSYAYRKL